jgi:hypothetical protein
MRSFIRRQLFFNPHARTVFDYVVAIGQKHHVADPSSLTAKHLVQFVDEIA